MRLTSLLFLVALAEPSTALRGDANNKNKYHRHLQVVKEPSDGAAGGPAPPAAPLPKKEGDGPKKDDPKKKEKKKCKKADKHVKKQEGGQERSRHTYSRKHQRGRNLQVVGVAPPPPPASKTEEEELPYCLHAEFTPEQCANLEALPKDNKKRVQSELRMELVHDDTQDSNDILREVEGILETDTQSRFIGCRDMKAPPPPRPEQRSRYALEDIVAGETFEEDESNNVDVIGVLFTTLQISRGDCKTGDIPAGLVCDVVQSNVDIFYSGVSSSSEFDAAAAPEEEDMKDLLIETIKSQATAGSFAPIGVVVEDVSLDDSDSEQSSSSRGNNTTSSGGDDVIGEYDNEDFGMVEGDDDSGGSGGVGAYVGGIAALLIVFGVAYWYGTKKDDSENEQEEQGKVYPTSDEDPDTE